MLHGEYIRAQPKVTQKYVQTRTNVTCGVVPLDDCNSVKTPDRCARGHLRILPASNNTLAIVVLF
jgi:hypothetical protein